jgi:cytochrome P450
VKASQLKAIRAELDQMASCYKPRNKPWTRDETEIVLDFYNKIPLRVLCEKLGRTADSIRNHISRLQQVMEKTGKGN